MARIVFDLDGTLIDSAPDIRAAVNLMLVEEGLAPLSLPEVIGFIGPNDKSFERIQVIRQLICEPMMTGLQVHCMACLL